MKNSIKFISALALAVSLMGCNQKGLSNEDFNLKVDNEVTEDGDFEVTIDFKEGTPEANYKLYLDGEIKASGVKKEDEKDKQDFEFEGLDDGEHIFKIEVESDGNKYDKEIKVKVDNKNDDNDNKEDDKKEELEDWDDDSKEYSIGDKVSFEDKNYECIQAHTSQEAWMPKDCPSLWKEIKE